MSGFPDKKVNDLNLLDMNFPFLNMWFIIPLSSIRNNSFAIPIMMIERGKYVLC